VKSKQTLNISQLLVDCRVCKPLIKHTAAVCLGPASVYNYRKLPKTLTIRSGCVLIFRLHKLGIEARAYANYTSLLCFARHAYTLIAKKNLVFMIFF